MKTIILTLFAVLTIGIGAAMAGALASYHAPAQNFYQNNWMGGG